MHLIITSEIIREISGFTLRDQMKFVQSCVSRFCSHTSSSFNNGVLGLISGCPIQPEWDSNPEPSCCYGSTMEQDTEYWMDCFSLLHLLTFWHPVNDQNNKLLPQMEAVLLQIQESDRGWDSFLPEFSRFQQNQEYPQPSGLDPVTFTSSDSHSFQLPQTLILRGNYWCNWWNSQMFSILFVEQNIDHKLYIYCRMFLITFFYVWSIFQRNNCRDKWKTLKNR